MEDWVGTRVNEREDARVMMKRDFYTIRLGDNPNVDGVSLEDVNLQPYLLLGFKLCVQRFNLRNVFSEFECPTFRRRYSKYRYFSELGNFN
jgi:hypothetical protein